MTFAVEALFVDCASVGGLRTWEFLMFTAASVRQLTGKVEAFS